MSIQLSSGPSLRFPGTGLPNVQAVKTISCWVNCPSTGNLSTQCWVSLDNASAAVQIGIKAFGALAVFQSGGGNILTAGTVTTNVLQHMCYTFDGTNHVLYVNGVSAGSASAVTLQTGTPTDLHVATNVAGNLGNLTIEDLRVYDRALSANEVQTLYASRGADDIVYGMRARMRMADKSSGTVTAVLDESEYNRAVTITGSPTYQSSVMQFTRKQTA